MSASSNEGRSRGFGSGGLPVDGVESPVSAISWASIIGGAVAAAALSLILLALGSGLGFSSVSPWSNSNPSATAFGVMSAIWLIVIQLVSAGLGGYLAGRLRTKWVGIHTDESYFRDTAHGFLAWALGAVVSAGLLASVASSIVGTGVQAAGSAVSGLGSAVSSAASSAAGQAAGSMGDPTAYFTDTLLRTDNPKPDASDQDVRAELGRVIAHSVSAGQVDPADKAYVAKIVAARTGVDQPTAEKRIDDAVGRARDAANKAADTAKQAAETARKSAAALSFWAFVSMLMGAFAASYAATRGGRHRDHVWA